MARTVLFACCTLTLVCFAGCKDPGPEIVRQKVPHIEQKIVPVENDRMLAALVTEKDKTWSFRLSGPETAVAAHKEKFDALLKSVKFGDMPPVQWTVPDGWKEAPGDQVRFATIKTNAEPQMLEVTVVPLPKEGGELLPNVNRWLGQLSRPPVMDDGLEKLAKPIEIDGRKGTIVDLQGKFPKKGKMPPMAAPPVAPKRGGAEKVSYELPVGWAKVKPKNEMIREQFDVVAGNDRAEATIVILPGGAGGEMANLQRWREQVKLPAAKDADELLSEFVKIDTKAGKAGFVDLDNPKASGNNRILGVIIPTPNATYFLKMIGPSELVGREKTRFEAFVKSLKVD